MPTVPTQESLGYDPIGGLPSVQASPAAFGAATGQALQRGGAQLGQDVDQIDNRLSQISANNATNKVMDGWQAITSGDPNVPGDTGFYGKKGQAAIDARGDVVKRVTDLYASTANSLDPQARQEFDRNTRFMMNRTLGGIGEHFEQQTSVAAVDSSRATQGLSLKGGSINAANESAWQDSITPGLAAVRNEVSARGGSLPEAQFAQQQFMATAYQQRVQSLIAQGNLTAAHDVLQKNINQFAPGVAEELQQHIQPQMDKAAGLALAARYMPGISGASGNGPVFDAIHGQESGGATTSATSVDGARGGMQITPATFQQYAQPGESIDNPADNAAVGKRIVDDYQQRYHGDAARTAVAYFSGPSNVAPAGSATPWLVDKADGNGTKTSAYVNGVLSRLPAGNAPQNAAAAYAPAVPDLDKAVNGIMADPNATDAAKETAIGKVTQYHHQMVAATASDRAALTQSLTDGIAALEAGHDYTPDMASIRRLMPDKADGVLADLDQARTVGQAATSVQFAAPADINAMLTRLRAGLNQSAGFVDHNQVYQAALKAVDARNKALMDDPATYVAQSPVVKAAAAGMNANDPASVDNYARTSLAEQARLGVPPSQQHVLSNAQAAGVVSRITSADPSTQDVGAMLDQTAKQYGRYWPQVYGDLVAAKLPGTYAVLTAMDGPDQARARTDLSVAIKQSGEMGGTAKYRASLPPAETKAVDAGVDDQLAAFQQTTRFNTDGQQLDGSVRDATKLLAYRYVAQGMDGTNAIAASVKAIIGDRYDMDGTMRTPKGMMGTVQTATSNVLGGLKPTDLADIGGDANLTPEQRQGIALDAARRGQWVPNHDDTGLVLMGVRKGGPAVVRLADGSPVQVLFANADKLAHPPAPAMAKTDDGPASVDPGGP